MTPTLADLIPDAGDAGNAASAREIELLAMNADLRAMLDERWSDASILRTAEGESGFGAWLKTPFGSLLAAYCAEILRSEAALNYVALTADHPVDGPLIFSVHRQNGQSPIEQLGKMRIERDAAVAQRDVLKDVLAAAAAGRTGSVAPGADPAARSGS